MVSDLDSWWWRYHRFCWGGSLFPQRWSAEPGCQAPVRWRESAAPPQTAPQCWSGWTRQSSPRPLTGIKQHKVTHWHYPVLISQVHRCIPGPHKSRNGSPSSVLLLDTGHRLLGLILSYFTTYSLLYYKHSLVGDVLGGWSVARFHLRATLG